MEFYLISHSYRNSQLCFIPNLSATVKKYQSRLSFRFTAEYTLRLYTPIMFYNFYTFNKMITVHSL